MINSIENIIARGFQSERGFSLIELCVVIIIIGIMTAVAMQSLTSQLIDAKTAKTEKELESLAIAIVGDPNIASNGERSEFGYVGDIGAFPPSLDALINNPGLPNWDGPYVSDRIMEDLTGFKTDEWGQAYDYTGGIVIASNGGPSTITRKIAHASSDYLLNSVNGSVSDGSGNTPGVIYSDSVAVNVTIPNGAGSYTTKSYRPNASGQITMDSLPVGRHALRVIYEPNVDTIFKYITVLPRHKSELGAIKFSQAYFATGTVSGSEILRPEGAGNSSLLSTSGPVNYDCVDEATADEDGSYVVGTGSFWLTDSYQTQDHATGAGTIDSLVLWMRSVGASGGKKARTLIRTSTIDYSGADINLTGVSDYTDYSTTYINNPVTVSPWTWTEIDNIEIGVEIFKPGRCTQVWVEIFYTN